MGSNASSQQLIHAWYDLRRCHHARPQATMQFPEGEFSGWLLHDITSIQALGSVALLATLVAASSAGGGREATELRSEAGRRKLRGAGGRQLKGAGRRQLEEGTQ